MRSLTGVIIAIVLAWSSTVSAAQPARDTDDLVLERAAARWDALLAGDLEQAYGYTSPSFRSAVSIQTYRARFGGSVRWLSSRPQSVTCGEERCDVVMLVTYRVPRLGVESERAIKETWLRADGDWWIHQAV